MIDINKILDASTLKTLNVAGYKVVRTNERGRSFPQKRDKYFFITECMKITSTMYINNEICCGRKVLGNCFKTRKAAEKEIEKRKLLVELREFAEEYIPVWDGVNKNYTFEYMLPEKSFIVFSYVNIQSINQVYFASQKQAEKAVQYFKSRLKILL